MKKIIQLVLLLQVVLVYGQQDIQFTHYMFNTMSVNPAYAGSLGHLTITGIHRTQWVGIQGAPQSRTLHMDAPIGKKVGLGLSVISDQLGPVEETHFDTNFSYTVKVSPTHRLSLGLKAGGRLFSVDWSKGQSKSQELLFQENIQGRFLPTIGAGLYLHSDKSYVGISIPNFLKTEHYNSVIKRSEASERIHLSLIAGLVMDLSQDTKFKPALLLKHVVGAPLIVDVSANFMFYDKFRLGAAYRWDDSISGLVGFQLGPKLLVGYSYDYTLTELTNFNSGTHEVMLRFELKTADKRLKSPRFF